MAANYQPPHKPECGIFDPHAICDCGAARVRVPAWQIEEIKNDALEFAAQLCEVHGRQLVTEDYRQVGRDMAARIRSRKTEGHK